MRWVFIDRLKGLDIGPEIILKCPPLTLKTCFLISLSHFPSTNLSLASLCISIYLLQKTRAAAIPMYPKKVAPVLSIIVVVMSNYHPEKGSLPDRA